MGHRTDMRRRYPEGHLPPNPERWVIDVHYNDFDHVWVGKAENAFWTVEATGITEESCKSMLRAQMSERKARSE